MGHKHSKPSRGKESSLKHNREGLHDEHKPHDKNNNTSQELQRVVDVFQEKNFKALRIEFTDINGITRCKMISVNSIEELASDLKRGFLFSPIWFMKDPLGDSFDSIFKREYWFTDICAIPALDTFRIIPWIDDTAAITTDLYHLNMKDLVLEHPRNVANHQLQRLERLGYSVMSGYELEFRLCDSQGRELVVDRVGFSGSTILLVKAKEYVRQLMEYLPVAGVDVDTVHSESPMGSMEVTYKPSFGIKAADDAVLCRNACKEIAIVNGYTAYFVPSPESLGDGFTLHLNHSIWDKTGNLVINGETGNLTQIAEYWIAGLLTHARALTPLMAPTPNGIKMFGGYIPPSSVEPSNVTWGRHNRSATFRVKANGSSGARGAYIENRLGRSDADPYLMLAGTVAAGMDGIINKLPLPAECTGDAHKESDIPLLTPKIPCDMEEGVAALLEDKVICEALGEVFIDLIAASRRNEIKRSESDKTS